MKKVLAFSLLAICLTSCGSNPSLSSEPFIQVAMWESSDDSYISLYDGLGNSYITFNGDVARMVGRNNRNDDRKYVDYNIACTYFNSSEGLIFTPNNQWFELYQGKTKDDYEGDGWYVSFDKPKKEIFKEYRVWGEYGNGWIQTYSVSSSDGIQSRSLYVTKSYAKKVGIGIHEYVYDSSTKNYISKNK